MTAVTSHLCLSGLISKMPPGSAKYIVMQLYDQTNQPPSLHLFILNFSETHSTLIFITDKYNTFPDNDFFAVSQLIL